MPVAYRLPNCIFPIVYYIDLAADPAWAQFSGSVRIELDVVEPTDTVIMHARGLVLSEARLNADPVTIEYQKDTETVRFRSAQTLERGRAELTVNFEGEPSQGMHGLYIAQDGNEKTLATQCEATDARAIFPCFDEPAFKASLAWTVRTSSKMVALANGPLESVESDGDRKVWRFAPTAPVSSYLAALTIGAYEALDALISNRIPLRVWALEGKQGQTIFARAFTEQLFPWYEEYFGLPYAYAKYDQVAVPGFDAG
ncbi:MAG: M1 family peptidase, partial [Myxococcota bacterium]